MFCIHHQISYHIQSNCLWHIQTLGKIEMVQECYLVLSATLYQPWNS